MSGPRRALERTSPAKASSQRARAECESLPPASSPAQLVARIESTVNMDALAASLGASVSSPYYATAAARHCAAASSPELTLSPLSHSLQADQIKLVALIIVSVPLSLVFPYLPSSTTSSLPHLFAALPSLVYLCFVLNLRGGFLQLVASTVATWCIVQLGVKNKMGKEMPWIVFAVVMGHLAVK